MKNELISVIVPIYNVQMYVRECLESIIAQTYRHLEIILVNDGSTDESMANILDLISHDNRIRVIHQANQGLSAARNAGLLVATGEYVTFVDSDDRLAPNAIELLYRAILTYQVPIAIGSVNMVSTDHTASKDVIFSEKILSIDELIDGLYSHEAMLVTAWGKLYRRELFKNISYPVGYIYEDEFTTYKLYLDAKCAVTIPNLTYVYRWRRLGSITQQQRIVDRVLFVEALEERLFYLKKHQLSTTSTLERMMNQLDNLKYRDELPTNQQTYIDQCYRRYWKELKKQMSVKQLCQLYKKRMVKSGKRLLRKMFSEKTYFMVRFVRARLLKKNGYPSRRWVYLSSCQLAYLVTFKTASSSILGGLLEREMGIKVTENVHSEALSCLQKSVSNPGSYESFSFTRSPFERIVSAYKNKVIGKNGKTDLAFEQYMWGILKKSPNFSTFVQKVVRIPNCLHEAHIANQYDVLYENGKCVVDYLGKYEQIEQDYSYLKEKYQLPALPHYNATPKDDWREYYDTKTAKLVYKKYKKDILHFGYEKDYQDLLLFLKDKGK